jgi:glutathione-specific gamma-glutamylcyclotransferase
VRGGDGDLWVFGYGSLMWDPGFAYAEARHARVYGYHRALCLLSVRNRGTQARPGLVLAMDRGGSCHGIAFRVAAPDVERTRLYLWEREMGAGAYRPVLLRARLHHESRSGTPGETRSGAPRGGDTRATVLAFVARPDHAQYFRAETPDQAASLVRQGRGAYGTALDYLRNVVCHLETIGIADGPLHRVLQAAEGLGQLSKN